MNSIKLRTRCAVYTRKSLEDGLEMEFNSLDAQREACERYIEIHEHEGWEIVTNSYDDGGFTGASTQRPALTRLFSDIRSALVDVVVVYKLDRLSRSLVDFLSILKTLEKYNVSFVSVTQEFNTNTPMGKLVLNVLMSFAEYEREIIRERVRDKIAASKNRGIWMGGTPPLGYNIKDRKLVINEEEAKVVRLIFDQFIIKRSIILLVRELYNLNVRDRVHVTKAGKCIGGKNFCTESISYIINNPIYIGKIRHQDKLYNGQHLPIISGEVWNNAHTIIKSNPSVRASITKRKIPMVLVGLLKCGGCEGAMTSKWKKDIKNSRIYNYYTPSPKSRLRCISCPARTFPAAEIEKLILEQLSYVFQEPEILVKTWREAILTDSSITEDIIRESLNDIFSIWKELFPAEQKELLQLVLEKVLIQSDKLEIRIKAEGLFLLLKTLDKSVSEDNLCKIN